MKRKPRLKVWRIVDPGEPWDTRIVRGVDWEEAADDAEQLIGQDNFNPFELEEIHDPED